MDYKKILNNKALIFIDKLFRKFGFYFEMVVDTDANKIINFKLRKKYL
jgi:hypothetical protein